MREKKTAKARKKVNLLKEISEIAKNFYDNAKNILGSAYKNILNSNWFYLVQLVLTLATLFFLYKLSDQAEHSSYWLLLAIVFYFLMFSFYKAKIDLRKPLKFNGIWSNIVTLIVICPLLAYVLKAQQIFVVMPLFLVNSYYEYEISKTKLVRRKSYIVTIVLMGIFILVTSLYATGLLEMKSSVLIAFYSASIAIYAIIITIFGIFLGQQILNVIEQSKIRKKESNKTNLRNSLIGLIRMCIVFMLLTLIAFLTGMYTTDIHNPPNLLFTEFGIDSLLKFYPIVMLSLVATSFPAVFIYTYELVKNYLEKREL